MTDPLIVDVYPRDGRKDWRAFMVAGLPWCGAIFKASQGGCYRYNEWLTRERSAFLDAAGDRYGLDAFDGFYDFLDISIPGGPQTELFVRVVEAAGGEGRGTLWGMVDVERGGQSIANPSRAQVEDCTRAWAERYHQLTGRLPTLYGGELLRSVGVKDRLGCGRSAIALYGATLPADLVTRTGTDLAHLLLWQYRGTDPQTVGPRGYPLEARDASRSTPARWCCPAGLRRSALSSLRSVHCLCGIPA